jgi:ATP-dependent exoDNAse (exonuclease V) beta subunit
MTDSKLGPVRVVTASAGTGKTHRLVTEVRDAVSAKSPVPAARILATTFTTRAAAELVSRARGLLVESGKPHEAEQLLAGRFGTVNSVFGALLREFAFEAGRSPVTEVIPEERAKLLFRMAADKAIGDFADRLQLVAERLGYAGQGRRGISWPDLVSQVISLARANGIGPEALSESKDRSWAGLVALLEATRKGETATTLDKALVDAVTAAVAAIGAGDGTKTTNDALTELREVSSTLATGRPLPWQQWARLSKVKAAKASNPLLEGVRSAAAAHSRHPRLREDVETMIHGIFDCAADALVAYRDFKLARGLVDFADQEAEALRLLDDSEVARILSQRLELALVDEFQDTSPIQLALFLRLARIVKRSLWVGDPKQSIYGFRGADPELMSAVAGKIATASGGAGETLATSYRSRPGLLALFNDVFVPAFERQGIPREQSECSKAHRSDFEGQSVPLSVWHIGGSNKAQRAASLANGVRRMLETPEAWSIVAKGEQAARPVRGGDVAILCRTGDTCTEVAAALENVGLEVALGRDGLLSSAECALAMASLRWLADSSDTLALAEISHLSDPGTGEQQPTWFSVVLSEQQGLTTLREGLIPKQLEDLRPDLLSMTPSEALDVAIGAACISERIAAWGNASQRHANLDALRALARDYEEDRRQARRPATAGGLVDWLEESNAEKPPSDDERAVVVSTYHGAKGLEWPVTILFQLDTSGRPRLFDHVVAESAPGGVDLEDPLKGRWLRLWPWPYGEQKKDVSLDSRAAQSDVGETAVQRDADEAVRLLYVAMTRARDYLVLAVDRSRNGPKTAALDGLRDEEGESLLKLPIQDGQVLRVGSVDYSARVWMLNELETAQSQIKPKHLPTYDISPRATGQISIHSPYRFRPSAPNGQGTAAAKIVERISLGKRLALTGSPDMSALGDAVHGFFAADAGWRVLAERERLVDALMARWGVAGALASTDIVAAADKLWEFISKRWPESAVVREWPVAGQIELQRVRGRIDLLIDTPGGLVIIDHKTYPGKPETWDERVVGYAAQLNLYGRLCTAATGKPIAGLFVHLPVAGALLRVASENGA